MFSIGLAAFAALTIWALLERAREVGAAADHIEKEVNDEHDH